MSSSTVIFIPTAAPSTHEQDNPQHPANDIPTGEVIKWLFVVFAFAWWVVIVLYFGVLDSHASLHLKVLSVPIVWASLALCFAFAHAMRLQRYGFAVLFFIGLIVSGLLA